MLMVKYTAEQTLTSNNPPEIAGDPSSLLNRIMSACHSIFAVLQRF